MLVLHGHQDDCFDVTLPDGRKAEVMIVENRCGKVKLGFTFPREVVIDRRIVTERKEIERGAA